MFKKVLFVGLAVLLLSWSFSSVWAIGGSFGEDQEAVKVEKSITGSYTVTVQDPYFALSSLTVAALKNGDSLSVITAQPQNVAYIGEGKADMAGKAVFRFYPKEGIDLSQGLYIAVGSEQEISFGEDKSTYIIARATHTVSVESGANGSVTPTTAQVAEGETATFTITPESGYVIDQVLFDQVPVTVNGANQYTTPPITGNKTLSVTFQKDASVPVVIVPSTFAEGSIELSVLETTFPVGFNKSEVLGKPAAITYAKYTGEVDEYGLVYSATNENPTDGAPNCATVLAERVGSDGTFLIYFYGKDAELTGNRYYVRSYTKKGTVFTYSETASTFTLAPVIE